MKRVMGGAIVFAAAWAAVAPARAQAQAVPAPAAKAGPTLNYFSEPPPNSGAATFNLGDRFIGPGFVTVGWLGSKKQIVLTPGEWVVLAAVDHAGAGRSGLKFTTFVFGKFAGDRLAASLTATINRYASPVNRWNDIESCAQAEADQLYHEASSMSATQTECVRMFGVAGAIASSGNVSDELRASLTRMGARAGGTAIVTQMFFAQKRDGYLRLVRTDWPAVALGNTVASDWKPDAVARSEARAAYVKGLVRWVQGYRPLAEQGFHRALEGSDLAAAGASRGPAGVSSLDEFEPAALPR